MSTGFAIGSRLYRLAGGILRVGHLEPFERRLEILERAAAASNVRERDQVIPLIRDIRGGRVNTDGRLQQLRRHLQQLTGVTLDRDAYETAVAGMGPWRPPGEIGGRTVVRLNASGFQKRVGGDRSGARLEQARTLREIMGGGAFDTFVSGGAKLDRVMERLHGVLRKRQGHWVSYRNGDASFCFNVGTPSLFIDKLPGGGSPLHRSAAKALVLGFMGSFLGNDWLRKADPTFLSLRIIFDDGWPASGRDLCFDFELPDISLRIAIRSPVVSAWLLRNRSQENPPTEGEWLLEAQRGTFVWVRCPRTKGLWPVKFSETSVADLFQNKVRRAMRYALESFVDAVDPRWVRDFGFNNT